jgi:hypothetical protein
MTGDILTASIAIMILRSVATKMALIVNRYLAEKLSAADEYFTRKINTLEIILENRNNNFKEIENAGFAVIYRI